MNTIPNKNIKQNLKKDERNQFFEITTTSVTFWIIFHLSTTSENKLIDLVCLFDMRLVWKWELEICIILIFFPCKSYFMTDKYEISGCCPSCFFWAAIFSCKNIFQFAELLTLLFSSVHNEVLGNYKRIMRLAESNSEFFMTKKESIDRLCLKWSGNHWEKIDNNHWFLSILILDYQCCKYNRKNCATQWSLKLRHDILNVSLLKEVMITLACRCLKLDEGIGLVKLLYYVWLLVLIWVLNYWCLTRL